MKTATISTSVGDYDNGCVFVLPPSNATRGQQKMNDGTDQTKTIRLAPPSHRRPSIKGDGDDNDDDDNFGHFIRQVNVPSLRRGITADPYSCQLVAESFSESVSVPVLPSLGPRLSCASFCSYESEHRFKESLTLQLSIAPASFTVSMVLYPDCTKKRFRTTVLCRPKLRPKRFASTDFVQPKRCETRYVSYVDHGSGSERWWHRTSVTVAPRTACSNFVRGFQFADRKWSGDEAADSIDDLDSVGSSGFLDDDCGSFPGHSDLELHLHDGDVGPDGYRTHMVVGGGK